MRGGERDEEVEEMVGKRLEKALKRRGVVGEH